MLNFVLGFVVCWTIMGIIFEFKIEEHLFRSNTTDTWCLIVGFIIEVVLLPYRTYKEYKYNKYIEAKHKEEKEKYGI